MCDLAVGGCLFSLPDEACSRPGVAAVLTRLHQMRLQRKERRGLNLEVAHSLSQWQSCMWAALGLNQLLCCPLPDPPCAWYWSHLSRNDSPGSWWPDCYCIHEGFNMPTIAVSQCRDWVVLWVSVSSETGLRLTSIGGKFVLLRCCCLFKVFMQRIMGISLKSRIHWCILEKSFEKKGALCTC